MPERNTNDGTSAETSTPSAAPEGTTAHQPTKAELMAQAQAMMKQFNVQQSELGVAQTNQVQWSPSVAERLSAGIFVFGLLLFLMLTVLIWKNKSVETLLRTFGILLIIVASVFLVIAGYSDQQIAPVMGLMGTIAGYLLSRRGEPEPVPASATPPAAPVPPVTPPAPAPVIPPVVTAASVKPAGATPPPGTSAVARSSAGIATAAFGIPASTTAAGPRVSAAPGIPPAAVTPPKTSDTGGGSDAK